MRMSKKIKVLIFLGSLLIIIFILVRSRLKDTLISQEIRKESRETIRGAIKEVGEKEPVSGSKAEDKDTRIRQELKNLDEISLKELQERKEATKQEEEFDLTPPIEDLIEFKKKRIKVY